MAHVEFQKLWERLEDIYTDTCDSEFMPGDMKRKDLLTSLDREFNKFRQNFPLFVKRNLKVIKECERRLDYVFDYLEKHKVNKKDCKIPVKPVETNWKANSHVILNNNMRNGTSIKASNSSHSQLKPNMDFLNNIPSESDVLQFGGEQIQVNNFQKAGVLQASARVTESNPLMPTVLQLSDDPLGNGSQARGCSIEEDTSSTFNSTSSPFTSQELLNKDELPSFSGNPLDWPAYYAALSQKVLKRNIVWSEKYRLILSTLPDEAKVLISNIPSLFPQCIEKMINILVNRYDISTFPSDHSLQSQITQMALVDNENYMTLDKALHLTVRVVNEVNDPKKKQKLFLQVLDKCPSDYKHSIQSIDSLINRIKRDLRILLEKPTVAKTIDNSNSSQQEPSLGPQSSDCAICEAMCKSSNHPLKGCLIAKQILNTLRFAELKKNEASLPNGVTMGELSKKPRVRFEDGCIISTQLKDEKADTFNLKLTNKLEMTGGKVNLITNPIKNAIKDAKLKSQIHHEKLTEVVERVQISLKGATMTSTIRSMRLLKIHFLFGEMSYSLDAYLEPGIPSMISRELLAKLKLDNFEVSGFHRQFCRIGFLFNDINFKVVSGLSSSDPQIVLDEKVLSDFSLTQRNNDGHCIWMEQWIKQIEPVLECKSRMESSQSLCGQFGLKWHVVEMGSNFEKLPVLEMIEQGLLEDLSMSFVHSYQDGKYIPIGVKLEIGQPLPLDDSLIRVINDDKLINYCSEERLRREEPNNSFSSDAWQLIDIDGSCVSYISRLQNMSNYYAIIPKN